MKRPPVPLAMAVLALALSWFAGSPEPATAERRADPYLVAAGDIACGDPSVVYPDPPHTYRRTSKACHEDATASMFAPGGVLAQPGLRAVLPLGDIQYPRGALSDFRYVNPECSITAPYGTGPCSFDGSWGYAAAGMSTGVPPVPIYPTPGNHEYRVGSEQCRLEKPSSSGQPYNACGYNDYFGNSVAVPRPAANGDGRGSYFVRFDTGSEHPMLLISLNVGQCDLNRQRCAADSTMVSFLRRTLASTEVNPPAGCAVVYYHQAAWDRYDHGDIEFVHPVWQAMLEPNLHPKQRPDLVLNGHDHLYERFEPLDASGQAGTGNPSIPQIIVGTGGRDVGQLPLVPPDSVASPPAAVDTTHFGVEKVSWSPERGRITASFYRTGDPLPFDPTSYRCRGAGSQTPPPPPAP